MQQEAPMYDKKDQYEKIASGCLPGEQIIAVLDMKGGGTGFIGITNARLIVYDQAFMRKNKAVVSIPYSRITSIAAEDESGLFSGRGFFSSSKVTVTFSGGSYDFEFRGADKAHFAHNAILQQMLSVR